MVADNPIETKIPARLRQADIAHAEKQIKQTDREITRLQKRRAELLQEIERLRGESDDND